MPEVPGADTGRGFGCEVGAPPPQLRDCSYPWLGLLRMGRSASPALQTLGEGQGIVDEEVSGPQPWLEALGPDPFGSPSLVSRSRNSHFLRIQDRANTKDVFLGDQTSRSSSIWRFRVRQNVCWGGAFCGLRQEASLQGLSSWDRGSLLEGHQAASAPPREALRQCAPSLRAPSVVPSTPASAGCPLGPRCPLGQPHVHTNQSTGPPEPVASHPMVRCRHPHCA